MWTFPILIDSRPSFLPAQGDSVLLAPLGTSSVLRETQSRLSAISGAAPVILTSFEIDSVYERTIRDECPEVESIEPIHRFVERCHSYEPSDVLLLADPTCFPRAHRDPVLDGLFHAGDDPRWVRHVVALQKAGGTREYVAADTSGRIRAIQRYYESVTWPFTYGVFCSLIPVACLRAAALPPLVSLSHLRHLLASAGVPSRDLPLERGAVNLGTEEGLLVGNEIHLREVGPGSSPRQGPRAGLLHAAPDSRLHPSATVLGPVALQARAEVEAGATIVGPAVVGPGARVEAGAILVQSVVGRGGMVGRGSLVRHRVVAAGAEPEGQASRQTRHQGQVAWDAVAEVTPEEPRTRRATFAAKRALDVLLSALALVALAPIGLVVAAAIRLESRGPIHFGHIREGRGGRHFRCWKFRTMIPDADQKQRQLASVNQMDGPQFKIDRDPRRTRVGRFLTATNLDELPQFWNVLVGDMSLVGPRPSPFRENQLCVPWREARLSVRPGITGLWQVCRHDRHKGDFHQWIYFDLLYVRNQSLWLDLKILAATLFSIARKGAPIPLSWLLSPDSYGERRAQGPRRVGRLPERVPQPLSRVDSVAHRSDGA